MKTYKFVFLAALSALSVLSCNREQEQESADKFLDVNVSFSHVRVKPTEGTVLTLFLFTDDVTGKPLSSLNSYRKEEVTLNAEEAKTGLRVSFEKLEEGLAHLYVLGWADVDADKAVSAGDLVQWYNASVRDVEEGKASPVDVAKEYAITFKMNQTGGSGTTEIPEGMVADYDMNLYPTAAVGPYIWITENLRTTHFQDGTEIPISEGSAFASMEGPACVNPYAQAEDIDKYGLLYNWFAAKNGNPCPEGYRIPSDAEVLATERFISPRSGDIEQSLDGISYTNVWRGVAEGLATKMKAAAPLFDGTDDFGLHLVPGGVYATSFTKGASTDKATLVMWTTDEAPGDAARAVRRLLQKDYAGAGRGTDAKTKGQSLRCIKDNPDYVAKESLPAPVLSVEGSVVSWQAVSGATAYVVSIEGEEIWRGSATSIDIATYRDALVDDKTYPVSVYCTGDATRYNDSLSSVVNVTIAGTGSGDKNYVKDYDGNPYEVVVIGTQTWMRENLRTTHFQDGTPIPMLEGAAFAAMKTGPAYVNPFGELAPVFGYLYNWYTIGTEGKNPCPAGYHAPSDEEYVTLERALLGDPTFDQKTVADYNVNAYRGAAEKLGCKMKSSSYAFGGDDDSVFNAMPAGTYGSSLGKDYSASTKISCLWTTTTFPTNEDKAMRRMLQHNQDGSGRGPNTKVSGHSVRCVKD